MTALSLSALADNVQSSVSAFVAAAGNDPLPGSECVKIAAAINALQTVYLNGCNGGA
jgi:hypothetical protein